MKVLFDHRAPFSLAHGGFQVQIEQTRIALSAIGIDVEYLRWWDSAQQGDLIHFFGQPDAYYIRQAQAVGKKVVLTTIFTETCNRSHARLKCQGWLVRAALRSPVGRQVINHLPWRNFALVDRNIVGLECEKRVLQTVYGIPTDKISVVPLGLAPSFLSAGDSRRDESHLICTGTITPRKCQVELALMARAAQTPILFVGKPYHDTDQYWLKFRALVDGHWVKYQPHTDSESEMITLLKSARGFVLMSWYENWCLSAHEAVACGLPVLLLKQNWSQERFGAQARYFRGLGVNDANVQTLKSFYMEAPQLAAPNIKLFTWLEVAGELKKIYERLHQAQG